MIRARVILDKSYGIDDALDGEFHVTRRQPTSFTLPVLGLCSLAIGVVAYYRPEESKQVAFQTGSRISTFAVELWHKAGWQEVTKTPVSTTRGYHAPQRFVKPNEQAVPLDARAKSEVLPASHDDQNPAEKPFAAKEENRPQVKNPSLAAPVNTPKLRELNKATSPKLQPTHSAPTLQQPTLPSTDSISDNEGAAVAGTPKLEAPGQKKLGAPQAKKILNPYAMKISDEGQSKSQTEKAVLEGATSPPSAEEPVGSGLAPSPPTATPSASGEKSVLRKRSAASSLIPTPALDQPAPTQAPGQPALNPNAPALPQVVSPKPLAVEEEPASMPPAGDAAPKLETATRKKPFTAILLDAPPMSVHAAPDHSGAPAKSGALAAPVLPEAPSLEADARPVEMVDHNPSNYQGVTPGVSREAEVVAALGAPTKTSSDGESKTLQFASSAFKQIEVTLFGGTVETIKLSLLKPLATKEVVKELGLADFEPGLVANNEGYVLGQVYPERGVVLQFTQAENGASEVEQIVLDRVTAEPFLLRALDDQGHRYIADLRDLETALSLDPQEPRALWLKANLLAELGQPLAALRAIDEAIRNDSASPGNRLTRAKILVALGRHGEASRTVASVLAERTLPPQAKARALCMQADLLASGPQPDFEQGVDTYQESIREASTLADDARPAVRRLARRILIESHLGVGRCIAWGQLDDAAKASAQWNERARLLAETAISDEDLADDIWLVVHRSVMSTHLGLAAKSDPEHDISELQLDYKRLLRSAGDASYRSRIKWEFALAMTDASRLQSARGKHRAAGALAETAWTLMAEGIKGREESEEDQFARAMLLYQLGSISAVAKENHAKAIEWYEQAIPLFENPLPESLWAQKGLRGLALIDMGASYWETGDQKQAIALSELGTKALQEASKEGHASQESLSLAFGNLESMYREMGDSASADRVAKQSSAQPKTTRLR